MTETNAGHASLRVLSTVWLFVPSACFHGSRCCTWQEDCKQCLLPPLYSKSASCLFASKPCVFTPQSRLLSTSSLPHLLLSLPLSPTECVTSSFHAGAGDGRKLVRGRMHAIRREQKSVQGAVRPRACRLLPCKRNLLTSIQYQRRLGFA